MTLDERAQNARDTLFKRYDVLNALWLQAEEQLTAFHVPRPASYAYLEYDDPDSPLAMIHERLGLQKIRGKWRICHGLDYDVWPDREQWTPITECSAEIRVRAVRYVQDLRKAIVDDAERFIPQVEEAIHTLATTVGLSTSTESQDVLANHAKLNGHHS